MLDFALSSQDFGQLSEIADKKSPEADTWREKVRMDPITLPRNIYKWDSSGKMTTLVIQ